jgi:hypothetical protein
LASNVTTTLRTLILEHLAQAHDRLTQDNLEERYDKIVAALETAIQQGDEPSPSLVVDAQAVDEQLDERQLKRARLIAELDRWIEFQIGKSLDQN